MMNEFKLVLEQIEQAALDSLPNLDVRTIENQLVELYENHADMPDAAESVRVSYDFILHMFKNSLTNRLITRTDNPF